MLARARVSTSVLALVGLAVLACGGCRAKPEPTVAPIDVSLLTGKPCEPPCWQGLVPEFSTEDDVSLFLENSRFVNRDSIFRGDITGGSGDVIGVAVQWYSAANVQGAYAWNCIDMRDGVVQSIETYLDFEVTLGELLDRYGPPTSLRAQSAPIPCVNAEVTLYYPELGLIARLELDPSGDHYELQPESAIQRVWYFSPHPLEDLCDLSGVIPFPYKPDLMETVL